MPERLKTTILILLVFPLLTMGCIGPLKSSDFKATQRKINKIEIVTPFVRVKKIYSRKEIRDDSLATKTAINNLQKEASKQFGKIQTFDIALDSKQEKLLFGDVVTLMLTAEFKRSIQGIVLGENLSSFLKLNRIEYAALNLLTGFTRTNENFAKEGAKGVAIGILSMGAVMSSPVKASTTLYTAVVDGINGKVVYYHKATIDHESTNKKVTDKLLHKTLKGFVTNKEQYQPDYY